MKQGFTLLELSIVIVIIGLIIGGITVGSDMIKSAELNSVATDVNKYKTAINTFKLKYNALPGDMKNAVSYWGSVSNCATDVPPNGIETCNGNNDGRINYDCGNPVAYRYESIKSWQHLSNAGLIPGGYSGVSYASCAQYRDDNTPNPSITGAVWAMFYVASSYGWATKNVSRHVLALGIPVSTRWHYPALIPADQKAIDDKMDDGLPNFGKLTHMNYVSSANCTISGGTLYNLTYEQAGCVAMFDF